MDGGPRWTRARCGRAHGWHRHRAPAATRTDTALRESAAGHGGATCRDGGGVSRAGRVGVVVSARAARRPCRSQHGTPGPVGLTD